VTAAMIPVVARSLVFVVKKGVVKAENEKMGVRASRLDTETGLAPMSSLGVVPGVVSALSRSRQLCVAVIGDRRLCGER